MFILCDMVHSYFVIFAVLDTPFVFNHFLYSANFAFGTFTVIVFFVFLKALLPTLFFVSLVVFMVTFFKFLHP